ncbi:MAG: hypothetical protein OEN01_08095 [Candidatus Krumholzibacteria bacterium]|nr:hypothetical protein [Candidatus Krumholzibacteria bacterium]
MLAVLLRNSLVLLTASLILSSCGDDSDTPMIPVESTTPSGWVWQNPLPQGNDLAAVSFVDAGTGVAVGAGGTILRTTDGTILRTTDGGKNWIEVASRTTDYLQRVFFADENAETAVYSSPMRTTPGSLASMVRSCIRGRLA